MPGHTASQNHDYARVRPATAAAVTGAVVDLRGNTGIRDTNVDIQRTLEHAGVGEAARLMRVLSGSFEVTRRNDN